MRRVKAVSWIFQFPNAFFGHFASFHTARKLHPCNKNEWMKHATLTLWYAIMIFIVDNPYKHCRFSFLARRNTQEMFRFDHFGSIFGGFLIVNFISSKNPFFNQVTNACSLKNSPFFTICSLNFEAISKTFRERSLQTSKIKQFCRFRAKFPDFWLLKIDSLKIPIFYQTTNACSF